MDEVSLPIRHLIDSVFAIYLIIDMFSIALLISYICLHNLTLPIISVGIDLYTQINTNAFMQLCI